MAEELQYSSDVVSNKRKYEEQTTPPSTRRPTGFSGPISSNSPDDGQAPPSYNSVPPSEANDVFQSAKQRAQEIASRLLFNASLGAGGGAGAAAGGYDAKRVRVEDGNGFDSPIKDGRPAMNSVPSAIPAYGYSQNTSKKIDIPNGRVGVIIGKSGDTIKYLQQQSGAKIQVTRDMDADQSAATRAVDLTGTPEQIARAEQLINDVLAEAEAGGSGTVSRRTPGQTGSEQFVMRIPNNKVGLVIGKGGETIKSMQASTGARIQVVPLHLPPGDTSAERSVHIDGTLEQVEAAKQMVTEVTSENRMRNSMGGGGYNQQGYQTMPQQSWGGAPQIQQQSYGYVQPGAYPGAQQYMSQPQYGGYPSQAATGGYAANWDQSSAPTPQQGGSGSVYDYYSQQQVPSHQQQQTPGGAPSSQGDQSAGYNYNSQGGYGQDGYGGYPSGYTQQPAQYDQQQQQGGYSSGAAGYGSSTTEGGHASNNYGGAQGGSSNQAPPPVSQSGYGYGMPPAYGQSPSTAGGYAQAPPPSSGYGAPPPPAASQPSYGQQQPSQYNGGYGSSGYPQPPPPPVYSAADGSGGAPPAASSQADAPPNTSPKS